MNGLTLFIGSKNLSSWSLRPWLLMKHHDLDFKEVVIPLDRPDTQRRILEHSPTGRVPALLHGPVTVWESLAICEYLAETFALPGAWPMEPEARAFARAVAHEMHSSFSDLRRELPFNATRDAAAVVMSAGTRRDIERICTIWREARSRFDGRGRWLMGPFGIVDAMFAPVALRFDAYAVELGRTEREYVDTVLAHPAIEQWIEAAAMEVPPQAAATAPRQAVALAAATPAGPPAAAVPAARPRPAPPPEPPPRAAEPAAATPASGNPDDIGEDEMPPASAHPPQAAGSRARKSPLPDDEPAPRVRSTILPPD